MVDIQVNKDVQLNKWGNSQGIRITKEILKDLNFSSNEIDNEKIKFEVEVKNKQIILNPIKTRSKLDELFLDFDGDPEDYKVSISWGDPVGKEIW